MLSGSIPEFTCRLRALLATPKCNTKTLNVQQSTHHMILNQSDLSTYVLM